jgi:peptide-methionine (R)-S-oxide reductase
MKRRDFLMAMAAGAAGATLPALPARAATGGPAGKSIAEIQQDWQLLLAKDADVARSVEPITKTEVEWKKTLPEESFYVLRKEGTERPFTSPLNDEKRAGVFVCAGCSLPLFSSQMKYDSGTGWPSFFTSIPGRLPTKQDFLMIVPRTEYHCVRCGGHQGHVFDDGPPPTRQRWCNNGVSLRFIPATGKV